MQKMSFTSRLLFWITIVGVIPLTVVGLYFRSAYYSAIRNSEKGHLVSSLHARSVHLQDWMQGVQRELLFVGKSNCVLGLCDQGHTDREGGGCPFLSAVQKSNPSYRYIAAYDGEGASISRIGSRPRCWPGDLEADVGRRAVGNGKFYIASRYCLEGDSTMIAVAMPVVGRRNDGGAFVIAALDFNVAVQAAAGAVQEPRPGEKFFILDAERRFVLPPAGHLELWGRRVADGPVAAASIPSGAVKEYGDFRGVPVLGTLEPVRGTDWLLGAEIDAEVAFRPARLLSLEAGGVLFVSLGLVMAVAFLMARRLSLPLRRLAAAAQGISEGRGWVKLPPFQGREAAQVSRAFNDMIESLRDKQDELARASSLAALGEFSSRTVHEMRGPLATIKLNLQGLVRTVPGGDDMAAMALEQVVRLEGLLREMLTLGKPLSLTREDVSFDTFMDEVRKTTAGELGERGVSLNVVGAGGMQLRVDRELMHQALTNLILNAAEWSARDRTVTVEGATHPRRTGWVRITVRDEGPGFMDGEEEKVFQPFYSTRGGGTGLGLAHTKKIVEYHGGTVRAATAPQGGALLTVDLPGGA